MEDGFFKLSDMSNIAYVQKASPLAIFLFTETTMVAPKWIILGDVDKKQLWEFLSIFKIGETKTFCSQWQEVSLQE